MANDDRPIVPGNHLPASPAVSEGGKAPAPTEGGHGHPKPAASRAEAEGNLKDGTSTATQGKVEKMRAEIIGAQKPQAGQD
jgi:hypothetical protein